MRTLVYTIITLVVALLTGCSSQKSEDRNVLSKVYDVDQVLAAPDSLADLSFRLEGVCTHVCQHGGKKLFLMGSDEDHTLRVEAGEKIGQFNSDVVNNVVTVTGKLVEERIDEAYLTAWENEIAAAAAEQHGEAGESGCATEMKAAGETPVDTQSQRIANFRQRIEQRNREEGKNYLSLYHIVADSYEIK